VKCTNYEAPHYNLLQPPIPSSLSDPNIFPSTLFSNTLNLCSESVNNKSRSCIPFWSTGVPNLSFAITSVINMSNKYLLHTHSFHMKLLYGHMVLKNIQSNCLYWKGGQTYCRLKTAWLLSIRLVSLTAILNCYLKY